MKTQMTEAVYRLRLEPDEQFSARGPWYGSTLTIDTVLITLRFDDDGVPHVPETAKGRGRMYGDSAQRATDLDVRRLPDHVKDGISRLVSDLVRDLERA